MNRFRLLILTAVCVMPAVISAAQEKPPIPLPTEPTTAIITMDWPLTYCVGGPLKNLNPVLTIRADGRVTVVDHCGRTANKETVLSTAELQELLRFAITEQDFFAFNASAIRQAISAEQSRTGSGVSVFDYPDTVVHIKTADREREVRFNALSFWAQRYPSINALAQLRAIELRLSKLVDELRAGTK